ncbi:hypothetical protein CC85DRAFT_86895 [Cutaneotrichosporon oleaginosum]|uniref:UBC core domain-containing protein n=1 Tax=Cutaneotrichosporon oleaginosum TaxID=879819 RepID=A0A0J0XXP3_9TREE|nr:uncharacterized protein CC85DRAFT_86895 [Cutaneotrichosporon oleaginosum]KLT45850.1 hypothetical protein CC85DRAFT_86895 [Cutaneotrichosporon oleaginosum]TXT06553.1 hypothetical protein COLE_05884 [Cutaneotrichosporon oleaginosum]
MPRGARDASGSAISQLTVRILSRGEWMSGCPEAGEQSFLFQLYNFLSEGSMACANRCGYTVPRMPQHFFPLFADFTNYTRYLCSILEQTCPRCSHVTCLACGESVNTQKAKISFTGELEALFHCSNIQGVTLGVALHMIEQAFGTTLEATQVGAASPAPKKRKVVSLAELLIGEGAESSSSGDEGDFRAAKKKGTGYSGSACEDTSGQVAAEKAQKDKDRRTATLLNQVAVYLPTLKRESGPRTSDLLVHPTSLAHLRRRSGFVNDLLRNDSLMDMSNRATIYAALMDWLEIVSSHEALATMLAMPSMRPAAIRPGPDAQSVSILYEGSPSPRELLESVAIQATAALKSLSANVNKPEDADPKEWAQNRALYDFCKRLLKARDNIDRLLVSTKGQEFVDRMLESLPHIGTSNGAATVAPSNDVKAVYEEWASKARFNYCSLRNPCDETSFLHAYNDSAQKLVGMDIPRRSLAIAKELAILTTNLPTAWDTSIFLRVDDERVDLIKALIIGPKDTPYENGCFIFDIFLPHSYNLSSPHVKSMTTNGGRFRYNPNLYADGKVCLSLLGTWSGPGWIPGKSTLLQVLISIQSLILCEEPYCNEPAWAGQEGSTASRKYSANVRRMTIIDAMANNIKNPPAPCEWFNRRPFMFKLTKVEDEIKQHFRLKANAIRAQLDEWQAKDDGKPTADESANFSGATKGGLTFDAAAAELHKLLDTLSAPVPKPRRNPSRTGRKA